MANLGAKITAILRFISGAGIKNRGRLPGLDVEINGLNRN